MTELTDMVLWATGDSRYGTKLKEYSFWGIQTSEDPELKKDIYVEGEQAKKFYRKIHKYIPDNYAEFINYPEVVGDYMVEIDIPVKTLKNQEESLKILKEYFPLNS